MEGFVNQNAKLFWEAFESSGNINFYMLFSAVQNFDEKNYQDVLTSDNDNSFNNYKDDGGMEM